MRRVLAVIALGFTLAGCVYAPGPGYGYHRGPGYEHDYYR
jgi:hypothetical protein